MKLNIRDQDKNYYLTAVMSIGSLMDPKGAQVYLSEPERFLVVHREQENEVVVLDAVTKAEHYFASLEEACDCDNWWE